MKFARRRAIRNSPTWNGCYGTGLPVRTLRLNNLQLRRKFTRGMFRRLESLGVEIEGRRARKRYADFFACFFDDNNVSELIDVDGVCHIGPLLEKSRV